MANYFEVVSKYKDANLPIPVRATRYAAGYDLAAAEDIIIPPFADLFTDLYNGKEDKGVTTLAEMASLTKSLKTKPTLVPTGMKCHLDNDKYLEISARSSLPLKHWLIVANGEGIIDADYYDNSDNEGLIFVQLINLSPFPIKIQKGEKIAQGIIKTYSTIENDEVTAKRTGGFGSTTK